MGNSAGPTRAAYRSCCTGQTERCMPWPAPALTWAARCRRAQSAMAASPAHGPAAPSGSPTAASCAARPARMSPATRRASRRAHRGPRLHIGAADLSHRRGPSQKTPFCAPRTDPTEEAVPLQNEHLFVTKSMLFPRRGDCRLAGGRVKDAWGRRCAAGLCPVLDPAARSREMAAEREKTRGRGLRPGS